MSFFCLPYRRSRGARWVLFLAAPLAACSARGEDPVTDKLIRSSLSAERLGVQPDAPIAEWIGQLRARVASRPRPVLFASGSAEDAESGAGAASAALLDSVSFADALLASGWKVREHAALPLQPPIAWDQARDGDVNWHYSLNALQPLDGLLDAYLKTQKAVYLEPARALLFDWIDFNLTRNLPNEKKWYDMGTGYRAEKLAFVTDDALRSGALGPREIALLLNAAVEHARVLHDPKNLLRGNHGVFMMLGLAALCQELRELTGCAEDAAYAQTTLTKVLKKQFNFAEGLHLEGAPGYHLFMGQTLAALGRTGLFKENAALDGLFAKVAKRNYLMFHPNGDPVLIGDSGANALKDFADASAEVRFVLSEGRDGSAPTESSIFPQTGYAVLRSPWSQHPFSQHSFLFFSAAWHNHSHNHFDHFTFEWSERGQPLVVDSGKYTYTMGPVRDFFRSTRAGNAVEIDGKNLQRVPQLSSLRSFGEAGPLRFVDAFTARAPGIEHTRLLVLHMGQWLCVVDRLKASASHSYRQWFHFHERFEAKQEPNSSSVTLTSPAPGLTLFVTSLGTPELVPDLVKGSPAPHLQGWISRDYMQMVPRYSVAFTEQGSNVDLITVLSLDAAVSGAKVVRNGDELSVRWRRKGATEGFGYRVEGGRGQLTTLAPR